ncbi:MAG: hypothetical protein DMG05_22785 [Acidobacteria bacterium]|nr:MAG: hypothetical protein DMG05_22785 [Acidobacteriota bacterium]
MLHRYGGFYFGVAAGDYDNEGYPDTYMTGYGRSVLYHNNGDGTFTDVTATACVANEDNWATAAGWFDFDHAGRLDLLVTNYLKYDWNHDLLRSSRGGSPSLLRPFSLRWFEYAPLP